MRGLTVVFPHAHKRGGVERVAWHLLAHSSQRRPTAFLGVSDPQVPGVKHLPVRCSGQGPRAFAEAAGAAWQRSRASGGVLMSFGANCPPGDVLWVHSVHRAFLEQPGRIKVGPVSVSARARRVLPRHRQLLALERDYFCSLPRAVLATSARESADLERLYGVDPALVTVLPNGFEPEDFNPRRRAEDRATARIAAGIAEREISLLFVANELHRKGLGVLLDAVERLGDDRLRIDVVGSADPGAFVASARAAGVLLHWHGPTSDVGRFYAAADLLVLPTQYEPFGMVVVEAMASGLPVVTSRLAGAASYITEGESGWLIDDPHDPIELAHRIRESLHADRTVVNVACLRDTGDLTWDRVLSRVDDVLGAL